MVNKILINNNDSNYTHSIFDISEYTGNSYSTLTDALNAIPQAKQKGGMTIRYVQTNDNKYVQYRYMEADATTADFTNVANWQGVDEKAQDFSKNLIESGDVAELKHLVFGGDVYLPIQGGIWGQYHIYSVFVPYDGIARTLYGVGVTSGIVPIITAYSDDSHTTEVARSSTGTSGTAANPVTCNVPAGTKVIEIRFVYNLEVIEDGWCVYYKSATCIEERVQRLEDIDAKPTYGSNKLVKSGGVYNAIINGHLIDYSDYMAPVGIIMEDGSISTQQIFSNYKLYTFEFSTGVSKDLIINADGIAERNGSFAFIKIINSDDSFTVKPLTMQEVPSIPIINYSLTIGSDVKAIQISSYNGYLSVIRKGYEYNNPQRVKYYITNPINYNTYNLYKGCRYCGVVSPGAVVNSNGDNVYYIANTQGTYTFEDSTNYVLDKNSVAIFAFKKEGIEKTLINTQIKEYGEPINIIDWSARYNGGFVNYQSPGQVIQNSFYANFAWTDYIGVTPGETLILDSNIESWGAFYDENKSFVESGIANADYPKSNYPLTVPQAAKYVRFSLRAADNVVFCYRQTTKKVETLPSEIGGYTDVRESPYITSYNAVSIGTVVEGKKANGITKTIDTDANSKYVLIKLSSTQKAINLNILPESIAFASNTQTNIVSGIEPSLLFSNPYYGTQKIWMYLNFDINTDINELAFYPYDNIEQTDYHLDHLKVPYLEERINNLGYKSQWEGKKILWLGTSIPWGQSDEDNPGTTTRVAHPYPQQVCDALGATLIDSTHGGLAQMAAYDEQSGKWYPKPYSAGSLASGGSTSLTITECREAQAAGLIQGDFSPYSYENSLLGKDADLYVFDVEPNNNADGSSADLALFDWRYWGYTDQSSLASHRNTYIGALIYEIDQLLTEKPNAIIVFVGEYIPMPTTGYNTPYAVREQSIALCEKFHIHYINLAEKLFYIGKNKSQWVNTDNVHPKQAAYNRMAKMLIHELMLIA